VESSRKGSMKRPRECQVVEAMEESWEGREAEVGEGAEEGARGAGAAGRCC
jgi:hypothetical protein